MTILTNEQQASLQALSALSRSAFVDLSDSLDTTNMSDSKSSVYALREATNALQLPDELNTQFQAIGEEAWKGVCSSSGDTYARCAKALAALGKLDTLMASVLKADSE